MRAGLDLSDTTFVTGYWHLGGNVKRSLEHYMTWLPRTLDMIAGGNLVVFSGEARIREIFETQSHSRGVRVEHRDVPAERLPGAVHGPRVLAACETMPEEERSEQKMRLREKDAVHYQRDYLRSGPETYMLLQGIWASKIPLVARIAAADPFGTQRFAWIDTSVSRFEGIRTNWDFTRAPHPAGTVSHYANDMLYRGRRLPLNASYLCGDREAWPRLEALFAETLEERLGDAYAHDEETLLSHALEKEPALFHCIGHPILRTRPLFRRAAGWLKRRLTA